jgi:hypothetical protein
VKLESVYASLRSVETVRDSIDALHRVFNMKAKRRSGFVGASIVEKEMRGIYVPLIVG